MGKPHKPNPGRNPNPPPAETQWKPGQSGNPGGMPTGTRRRIQTKFLEELAADFELHGKTAIKDCREQKPEAYVKVCAALLPKEMEITSPLDSLDDDTLATVLVAIRAILAAGAGKAAERGAGKAEGAEPTH